MIKEKKDNQESDYIYITKDRGIKKKILKKGQGIQANEGLEVQVKCLEKSECNNIDEKKEHFFSFKIGEHSIDKGIEIGVKTMKVGEKAKFIIGPDYTHKNQKESNLIRANSIFEIELIKVISPRKGISDMNNEEKLDEGKKLKGEGVEKYKEGDIN